MKKQIFSVKLYLQGLKKVRAAGIAASICVIVLNAIIPIVNLINRSRFDMFGASQEREIVEVTHGQLIPFSMLFIIFAPILVYTMFSYLNERSKSDFFHSLPQTRTCVFISFLSAIVTWELAILAVSTVVNSILWALVPYYHVGLLTVLGTWAHYAVLALLMTGFMTLAMTLTGTVVSNFLIFALVTLFVRTAGTLFIYSVENITPVFILSESWLRFLSFEYFLPWDMFMSILAMDDPLDNMALLAYSFGIAILLLAASAFFYKRRRSEIAGQSAPNKRLHSAFRSAVTIPFILIIVFSICSDGVDGYQLVLAAIALLVYCLYELMTQKKIKLLIKAMPKIIIPLVAGIVFMSGIFFTRNIINGVTPSENEISSISLLQNPSRSQSYESLVSHGIPVNNAEASKIVSEALWENIHHGTENWHSERMQLLSVSIELDSGRTVARKMYVTGDDYTKILELFATSDEYKKASLPLPKDSEIQDIHVYFKHMNEISAYDTKEVWESFKKEYGALSEKQQIALKALSERSSHENITPVIHVWGRLNDEKFYSKYPLLNQYTPKTTRLFAEELADNKHPQTHIDKYAGELNELAKLDLEETAHFDFHIEITPITADGKTQEITLSNAPYLQNNKKVEKSTTFFYTMSNLDGINRDEDSERTLYCLYAYYNYSGKFEGGKYSSDYKAGSLALVIALTDDEYKIIEEGMDSITKP